MYIFRWNDWNIQHIGEHGVAPAEAEHLVKHAGRSSTQRRGDGRYLVVGRFPDGSHGQVAFVFSPPGVVYVIHARPLTDIEKRRLRRRQKP